MVLLPRLVSLMEYPGSQAGHEEEPTSPEDLSMTCSPEGTGDLERLPVELAARPQEGSWRAVGSLLVFPFLLYFCFNLLSSKTPLLVPSSGCQRLVARQKGKGICCGRLAWFFVCVHRLCGVCA
jgi:hypothetical protein